ncbi:MAG: transcription antitermination factor NusB [Calditrichaeota bacterium]|nr:MAG: transcription antitermination factor NusB [Calditrichota bacterium]
MHKKVKIKRRKEREYILQILYAQEFNTVSYTEIIEHLIPDYKLKLTAFIENVLDKCIVKKTEIDKYYIDKLQNWDIKRVAVMDKILLRMAVAEFLFCPDIPPEVTINEIIEISKVYSTDRSSKFLNGILDAVLKELKNKNLMKKTGRGLIASSG